jgi:hypothetical protein
MKNVYSKHRNRWNHKVGLQNFETWDTIEDHKTMGAIDYSRNMSKYVMVKVARRLFNMYIHGNGNGGGGEGNQSKHVICNMGSMLRKHCGLVDLMQLYVMITYVICKNM